MSFIIAREFINNGNGSSIFRERIYKLFLSYEIDEIQVGAKTQNIAMILLLRKNNFKISNILTSKKGTQDTLEGFSFYKITKIDFLKRFKLHDRC